MILQIRKIIFIHIIYKFKSSKNFSFLDLNFRKIDFTNYQQIKSLIFKENFYLSDNKNIHSFDFLNFSNKLGGKIGINLSKKSIFSWFKKNKNKLKRIISGGDFFPPKDILYWKKNTFYKSYQTEKILGKF